MSRRRNAARAAGAPPRRGRVAHALGSMLLGVLLAALALQGWWVARIAALRFIDPSSTTFQRSELWRLLQTGDAHRWRQQWVPYERISPHLKRAVVAAEDAGFVDHFGVDWDAVTAAWQRNQRLRDRARGHGDGPVRPARVAGGSTITQQLAKNLFLSGERTLWRKGQELWLTWMLEALLNKRRILEIYLNSVEWGDGVFGAEAAAQHYFRKSAAQLSATEAARLAALLPAPKRYGKRLAAGTAPSHTRVILERMGSVRLP